MMADDNCCKNKIAKFPIQFGSSESTCLILSSCTFMIPAYYALMHETMYLYGVLSIITSLVSINYWRYADIGHFSRYMDLCVSKVSFIIYFVSGVIYFYYMPSLFSIALPICLSIIYSFHYSGILWSVDKYEWMYLHVLFHILVAIEQCLVIYAGIQYYGMDVCVK